MRDSSRAYLPASRPRSIALAALLVGELIALMARFDTGTLRRSGQVAWADTLWDVKIFLPPLAIAIATAAMLIGGTRLRDELRSAARDVAHPLASTDGGRVPRAWPVLLAHLAAFALFARLTAAILEGSFAAASVHWPWIVAWVAVGVATLALWVVCLWPARLLAAFAGRSAPVLIAGATIGAVAWAAGLWTETWWEPLRDSTIAAVGLLVRLIASDAVVDAPALVVGTSRFSVRILSACAGYEGIGLIWVFTATYLWMFRRTLRFPRAFLLLPIGTAAMWAANALRLTALIMLGTWVSADVALGGFHVYCGSLLFSAIALGLAAAASRMPFFSASAGTASDLSTPASRMRTVSRARRGSERERAVAGHLLPFIVLLAAGISTRAFSGGVIDYGYPLQVAAVLATLWMLRGSYRRSSSDRPNVPSNDTIRLYATPVLYGVVAFVLWIALEPPPAAPAHDLGAALVALPPGAAILWLAFRVVGSTVTVPIAEELAFRGYLARRLASADFERLSPQGFTWLAGIASSLLFGAMHSRIVAGTLAGALYFLCFRRRARLVDPILAHATSNGLIAVYVLATGNFALWA